MGRRKRGARILGPYHRSDGRWQIRIIEADGEGSTQCYPTKADAEEAADELKPIVAAAAFTIHEALKKYQSHKIEEGRKAKSYEETDRRLRLFIGTDVAHTFGMLSPRWGERRYAWLTGTYRTKDGNKLSVDSHRNTLAEAKTFFVWCVSRKYLAVNPLDHVKGIGRRRKGKAQLRIDESRRFDTTAVRAAESGDDGALAALIALYLTLRASEIVGLRARDIDDKGHRLWVTDSKTDAGRRSETVPDFLATLLVAHAKGKRRTALLFPHRRDWVRENVLRLCDLARVPRVCAHGLRGTHATLALDAGSTSEAVARAMGHASFETTAESYAKPESVKAAAGRKVFGVIRGGKK